MTVIAVIVLAAIAVRAMFFQNESGDYLTYFARWYDFIVRNGRWQALAFFACRIVDLRYPGRWWPILIAVTGIAVLALIIPVVLRRFELTATRIVLAGTVSRAWPARPR